MDQAERGVEEWYETASKELASAGYKLPPEKVVPITRSVHYTDKRKGA